MLAIQDICASIAAALAASSTIAAYCQAQFGRPLRVCLGAVGSDDQSEDELAPYVEVFPSGDGDGDIGGETAAETAQAGILLCIDSSVRPEGWEDASKQDVESGVRSARFDPRLFGLHALIRAEACRDGHGGIYQSQRSSYDGMTAYPICYASIVASFRQHSSW